MQSKTMQVLGSVLLIAGVATIGVGVAGEIGSWGAKTEATADGADPAGGSGAGASSTTSTTLPPEDATQFLDALGTALRTGDTNFLIARLHPAVVARYGNAQCLGALAGARDASAQFTLKAESAPADFDWTTDDKTVRIPDTLTVEVDRVQRGVAETATLHITLVGSQLTWLVDCGNPIGP